MRLRRGGSRRHLRERTAFQADTEGVAAVRGRCPRLLTVQPSRLDSLACQRAVRAGLPCRVAVQGCRVGLLCRVAVQGFECSLCRVCVGFVYSLRLKLYISQRAEYQRNVGLNVGFVYSLYSFFVSPFIYV